MGLERVPNSHNACEPPFESRFADREQIVTVTKYFKKSSNDIQNSLSSVFASSTVFCDTLSHSLLLGGGKTKTKAKKLIIIIIIIIIII